VTLAAPPLNVAANCSTSLPEVLLVLHPVQLVSMAAAPGEMESAPLEELPPDVPPPQPARTTNAGKIALASIRPGDCRMK